MGVHQVNLKKQYHPMVKIFHNQQLMHFNINSSMLLLELFERGIDIEILDKTHSLFQASFGAHTELLHDVFFLKTPEVCKRFFDHKLVAKKILSKNGIRTPEGQSFETHDAMHAQIYAELIGYPVVIKPLLGVQGNGVFCQIETAEEFKAAWQVFQQHWGKEYTEVLVEKSFTGDEFRIFITETGDYAALKREPASVMGDGKKTIEVLARQESYRRLNPRKTCEGEIVIDEVAQLFLAKQGLTQTSIPQKDKKVFLRANSNLSTGGRAIDYTDQIHPSVIAICQKVLQSTQGLPYAGIDFMSRDITADQGKNDYVILEVNVTPGIGIHVNPGSGQSRPVPAMIADIIFPETKKITLKNINPSRGKTKTLEFLHS